MPYILPDGTELHPKSSFKLYLGHLDDTVQFGAGSLETMDPDYRAELGITWQDPPTVTFTLEEERSEKLRILDEDAERIRLKYITGGDGMIMTYREKLEQAEQSAGQGQAAIDALSDDEAKAAYPTLSASVGIEGATLWDCTQLVLTRYQQWATLSHHIEKTRLTGKKAINEATTVEGVQAAYNAINWDGL